MATPSKPDIVLFLDDHRGVFIPRDFAQCVVRAYVTSDVKIGEWLILEAGPQHESYWDVWQRMLDTAVIDCPDGKFRLYQDGALWLIPDGMEWSDKDEWFVWPDDEVAS